MLLEIYKSVYFGFLVWHCDAATAPVECNTEHYSHIGMNRWFPSAVFIRLLFLKLTRFHVFKSSRLIVAAWVTVRLQMEHDAVRQGYMCVQMYHALLAWDLLGNK